MLQSEVIRLRQFLEDNGINDLSRDRFITFINKIRSIGQHIGKRHLTDENDFVWFFRWNQVMVVVHYEATSASTFRCKFLTNDEHDEYVAHKHKESDGA